MSNARIAKLQLTNIVVGNAPALGWIVSDNPIVSARLFSASGPPSETTLLAGNGRYCASTSGFVCNATLGAAGTAYAVGDVLTGAGGTASAQPQFTVDAVDAAGKILDFHCTRVGVYSVYPTSPITPTGGSGSGATFNLALQPADFYLDSTANALYVCTTSGTNATSVWQQISGGGSSFTFYDPKKAYAPGAVVQILATSVVGGVTLTPGTYGCMVATVPIPTPLAAPATVNMVPQFPYPTTPDSKGVTVYWMLLALAPQPINVCAGGNSQIYINASATF